MRCPRQSPPRFEPGTVDVIEAGMVPDDLPFGSVSAVPAKRPTVSLRAPASSPWRERLTAICTAPISKEALHAAGPSLSRSHGALGPPDRHAEVSMMLTAPKLRVIPRHHPYWPDRRDREDRRRAGRAHDRAGHATSAQGRYPPDPRIGVCAINPHAGEGGLFGRGEEAAKIEPAVAACRAKGWSVEGPLPADTLFFRAGRGDFEPRGRDVSRPRATGRSR